MATVQPPYPDDAIADGLPIVAVGASAGGLAPTIALLRELGALPRIALVIVHHLDPTHDSGLVEILGRATAMPVVAATDGVRVERDHVYVVPPNAGLLIRGGILHTIQRLEEGGLHLPIDRFCESLAKDRNGLSVGVVLSGSGFDGTAGIRAIKREGGITMAQDTTASFGSMPESAIATGCVDFVLPPAGLARELARIGAHAPSFAAALPQGVEGVDEPGYPLILAAMQTASGVDFASYRHATLRRRILRRLFLRGLTDLAAYAELLKRDPTEIGTLCEEVLIHVTGFFREPEGFDALRTQVLPTLCKGRGRDAPIRIWVPGCSTGEEVYSIAMCLLELMDEARQEATMKIFGTDISLAIVEKARAGRYPESIENEVSPQRLQRFFTKSEAGYQIRRDVRDLCVFAKHDVTRDPPFSAMDLISCRNLMIYLGPELQDRVIARLHYALSEPGFLALGRSETVRAFGGFAVVDGKNKIYARTSAGPRPAFDFTTSWQWGADVSPSLTAMPFSARPLAARSDVHREADRLVLEKFAPSGVVFSDDLAIVEFRGKTGPFLEPAPGAATLDLLRLAREELRLPLRRAIDQARATQRPTQETGLALHIGDKRHTVTLEVIPFAVHPTRQRFFVALFEDLAVQDTPNTETDAPAGAPARGAEQSAEAALRQDLASTRQYLESVIEQGEATNEELRAANEEVVSSNEELRSTNEELQSAKEEMQASNEELRTVNDELNDRNLEATRLSDDLTNVLHSIEIPILFVDRDLRLRKYTPAAARLFGARGADLGHPLSDAKTIIALAPALEPMIPHVMAKLRPESFTVKDGAGAWWNLSVRPYVTQDGRIDGVVVAGQDIDAQTKISERIDAERKYAESIVETLREGLIALDRDLRARSANPAFLRMFRLDRKDVEGRRLDELGRPELSEPALLKLLEDLPEGQRTGDFRLHQRDAVDGDRVFLANACRIDGTRFVLLAIEDITQQLEAETSRAYREQLQGVVFDEVVTQERERRLLAELLHDGIVQDLVLAKIRLTSLETALAVEHLENFGAAVELLDKAIEESRSMVFDLSPPILYDLGLADAIGWLVEDVQKRYGLRVELTIEGESSPLDDAVKSILFRAARELVINVVKHAQTPAAAVALRWPDGLVEVEVEDRGVGFESGPTCGRSAPITKFGLLSIREQVLRLDGVMQVVSAPGKGTRVTIRLPLQSIREPRRNSERPAEDAEVAS